MTWLVNETITQESLAEKFTTFMHQKNILQIPGAHDAMAGLMAKRAGFEALYLSGGAFTASKGLPDLGMITSEEVANRAKEIIRATNLQMLVDIDTDISSLYNVVSTAEEMQEAKEAAVQIEDQQLPKKCVHLNGKNLVTAEEMAQKISVIKQVAPSLVVIARTDAHAVEGLESAIERTKLYVEAG